MEDFVFKNCPFCGGTPMLDVSIVFDEYFGTLHCRHCDAGFSRRYGLGGFFEDVKADLMKRWNRRSCEDVPSDD